MPEVVDGLSVDELLWRPDARREPHRLARLAPARQQDDQVAHLAGEQSAWLGDGWIDRFGLPYAPDAHGLEHELGGRRPVHGRRPGTLRGEYQAPSTTAPPRCSQRLDADAYERVIDGTGTRPSRWRSGSSPVLDDAGSTSGRPSTSAASSSAGADGWGRRDLRGGRGHEAPGA